MAIANKKVSLDKAFRRSIAASIEFMFYGAVGNKTEETMSYREPDGEIKSFVWFKIALILSQVANGSSPAIWSLLNMKIK